MFFKDKENNVFHLSNNSLNKKHADWVEISEAEMIELTHKEGSLDEEKMYAKNRLMVDYIEANSSIFELNGKKYDLREADLFYFETLFNGADEIDFILVDNSVTRLNKSDFETLKQMLAQRRNELMLKLRDLKNQIDSADSVKKVKEIKWL